MEINEKQETVITDELRTRYGQLSGAVGIGCNIVLAVSKLVIGLLSGSVSIVADAVNNFSDAASSIISLVGFRLAARPADEDHPFGHARYEYISGMVVSFLVMLAGVELLKSSAAKVLHPEPIEFSAALVIVLVLSIAVKLWMSYFNRKMGKKIDSGVLLATADDSRNDCVSTGAVLLAAILSQVIGVNLDGIMGVLVALFILYSGVGLIKDTTAPLLGGMPDPELVEFIEKKVMGYEGVLGIHDLIVHDYGPGRQFASVHVEMAAEADVLHSHEIIDRIEQDFLVNDKLHTVIHFDPIVTADEHVSELRQYLTERVKEIDPLLTIHDLRIVPGELNTNVIFDCVLPHECKVPENQVVSEIKKRLREGYPDHTAVIKVENNFVAAK